MITTKNVNTLRILDSSFLRSSNPAQISGTTTSWLSLIKGTLTELGVPWTDECCDQTGPSLFCAAVNACLGISPEGDPDLVLNQQGDWISAGGGSFTCEDVNECLGISEKGDPDLVLNQQGEWVANGQPSEVEYGTYSPIFTNVTIDSITFPGDWYYTRIGNIVTISAAAILNNALPVMGTTFNINLPIPSVFTSPLQGGGVSTPAGNKQIYGSGIAAADVANSNLLIDISAPTSIVNGLDTTWVIVATYQII